MSDPSLSSLIYTGVRLDRAGINRKDEAWIAFKTRDGLGRIVAVWRNRNLIIDDTDGPRALIPRREDAPNLAKAADNMVFLGLDNDNVPVFSVDISHLDEHDAVALAGEGGSWAARLCARPRLLAPHAPLLRPLRLADGKPRGRPYAPMRQ